MSLLFTLLFCFPSSKPFPFVTTFLLITTFLLCHNFLPLSQLFSFVTTFCLCHNFSPLSQLFAFVTTFLLVTTFCLCHNFSSCQLFAFVTYLPHQTFPPLSQLFPTSKIPVVTTFHLYHYLSLCLWKLLLYHTFPLCYKFSPMTSFPFVVFLSLKQIICQISPLSQFFPFVTIFPNCCNSPFPDPIPPPLVEICHLSHNCTLC